MTKLILLFLIVFGLKNYSQTKIITKNNLTINHGDMILYLSDDTASLVSKLSIKYSDFKKIDSDRDNHWFQDVYKGKYNKEAYVHSGYDLGHLTPSHITSYNDTLNHASFSLFNQAPQLAGFNRGSWAKLEASVEDSIKKLKSNAEIITGVIYDYSNLDFLNKTKIKIPVAYFKVLKIKKRTYAWMGSNNNGSITLVELKILNEIFVINKMNLIIN